MQSENEKRLFRAIQRTKFSEKKIKDIVWRYLQDDKLVPMENISQETDRIVCGNFTGINENDMIHLINVLGGK